MQRLAAIAGRPTAALAASGLCFLLDIAAYFPGKTDSDGDAQYAQAVSGHYTDWHPPIMARLWALLRLAMDGKGSLFLLHAFFYWLGFGLIAAALCRSRRSLAGWAVFAVAMLPPFLFATADIMKDIGMAVSLLASCAVVFWYRSQDRKIPLPALGLALLLLFYGALVRANGIFAAAPLAVYLFFPHRLPRPARFLALCLAIMAVAVPAAGFVNHKILNAETTDPMRSLQLFDLTGIAYFARDMSVFWTGPLTQDLVNACYHPAFWDTLGQRECHVFWDSPSPQQGRHWALAIADHPLAYAAHRIAHFNSALDFIVPWHSPDARVKAWIVHGAPLPQSPLPLRERIQYGLRYNPVFSPIFALILGCVTLLLCAQRREALLPATRNLAIALLASGLLYCLGYLFVGVASDLRYQYWPMLTAFLGGAIYLAGQRHPLLPPSRRGWLCIGIMLGTAALITTIWTIKGDALFPAG